MKNESWWHTQRDIAVKYLTLALMGMNDKEKKQNPDVRKFGLTGS